MTTQALLYDGFKLTSGGKNDPLLPKLKRAINNADEIEIAVSFIQPSGIKLLEAALEDALARGASVKIITSDYLCITSPIALKTLMVLQSHQATVKIFQCKPHESFHMKSYIFVRNQNDKIATGCAFIGSNNISKSALTHATEWCLRYDYSPFEHLNDDKEFSHIRNCFKAIEQHSQSIPLTHQWIAEYELRFNKLITQPKTVLVDDSFHPEQQEPCVPNEIQQQTLTALNKTRQQGFKRGLVVLATGMGKTWLSAFDVMQFNAKRVLFVAHREEILIQAQRTFATLITDAITGLYNSTNVDRTANYLFASIQTIGKSVHLEKFSPLDFDYIIVDEFHHASASTYRELLAYFQPKFLLGLTATPERSDQADILSLVDNNLVFERNLVHGIEANILVPFEYHGIYDEFVDYQEIPWRNGQFDPTSLNNAFATIKRAKHIHQHWLKLKQSRTLAFCISKQHADYMAKKFNSLGYNAVAAYSGSSTQRNDALTQLELGEIDIIFSVDLFNEGTDLPAIDTILMIRPTQSKILFLQQLGRGLRTSKQTQKEKLVVIDFIGNHQSFLNKPSALLGQSSSTKGLISKLNEPDLPDNCHLNFDPELIQFWETLHQQLGNTVKEEFRSLQQQLGHRPTATEYFQCNYDFKKIRKKHGSWYELVRSELAEQHPHIAIIDKYSDFLFGAIEATAMSKCFKPILLEAFLELDGFITPPTIAELAERSWYVLDRRPDLKMAELPEKKLTLTATSKGWHQYWKANPINAFTKENKNKSPTWFSIKDELFIPTVDVAEQDKAILHELVQELVDYRLAKYIQTRLAIKKSYKKSMLESNNVTSLPFYPKLSIACGHFKAGSSEQKETIEVPRSYGNITSKTHFVAPAVGNSMNGGSRPILDGDLLLLEWVTPISAGSISNLTMAIERQDSTGDSEYLLRVIRKGADGQYVLKANNQNYSDQYADDTMRTFARFVDVITP
ncbi:DEAD/DEAH box helicase family protein [Psychrobium sp. 1_MG-2023]|uniref:DEAD/DEAH box helicase family protein n=1 Tax=Psychrobium sp. 1_MG-2023 TaxID=3062624 RepID=UPI000C32EDB5|nr:DEAD/DEAH box helicase family protein [Psychrobium sp. 1_MG-2023]MDP2562909.1 DEAD/DEAH box helicase family protein [Psychrobium sp. 1_MG-2023]PKF54709.1 DEAD/DEAH box helicase [Alteromonadales bacterium alter-6D02]